MDWVAMKVKFLALLVLLVGIVPRISKAEIPSGPKPLTLQDCYELAKNQSEKIRIQTENISQAKARKGQALGSVLPNVHWLQTTTWQDQNGVSISSNADSTLFRKQRTESRFQLKQPIFSGFR